MEYEWESSNGDCGEFKKIYYCSSYTATGMAASLENGGKISLPQSALPLFLYSPNVSFPMQFAITNYDLLEFSSHCGVLEFVAEEGYVYMPQWMMHNMGLNEGSLVVVSHCAALPSAEHVKLLPHTTEFIHALEDPKAVLEEAFWEYSCLTTGDAVVVCHKGKRFYVDVLETRPSNAVSVIDTDCEVDFEKPLDYKEPESVPVPVPIPVPEKANNKIVGGDDVRETKGFLPFTGIARTIGGKITQQTDSNKGDELIKSSEEEMVHTFQAFTGHKYTLQ